jgi:membrane protein
MQLTRLPLDLVERARHAWQFLSRDVWLVRLDTLPPRRATAYRGARVFYCTMRGLVVDDTLNVRAAALTYYTVLSLVPLLAFAFALLKGFGAYERLVDQTIRPYLLETFSANQPLRHAFEQVLELVSGTGVTSLGFLGLVLVLYSGTRLLRNIEGALNTLWQVESARGPLAQVTDYLAIIVITPLCLLLAAAVGTVSQLANAVRAVGDVFSMGELAVGLLGVLLPATVVFLGLCFLYMVMPNTKVRAPSALLGAVVGAVLWWCVLVAHVRFQVGVARFNALYASFGAIPIFLVWVYVSWLTVLVGAQVAATHQHERMFAQRIRAEGSEQVLRETVCLAVMIEVSRAFMDGRAPPRLTVLADRLSVPLPLLQEVVARLRERGLVLQTGAPDEPAIALGQAPERVTVKRLLDSMRRPVSDQDRPVGGIENLVPALSQTLQELDHELARSRANRNLRELVGAPGERELEADSSAESAEPSQPAGAWPDPSRAQPGEGSS